MIATPHGPRLHHWSQAWANEPSCRDTDVRCATCCETHPDSLDLIGSACISCFIEAEAVSSPCEAGVCEVAWHPTKPVGAVADYRANGFHVLSA